MLFASWKGNKHLTEVLHTEQRDNSEENQTQTTEFKAKAEYSNPLEVTIFKVQCAGLKHSVHSIIYTGNFTQNLRSAGLFPV